MGEPTSRASASAPSPSPFAERLTLLDAAVIVVSGIIGSGIFINPYVVAGIAKTPALILLVWVLGGLIALCGAFVFAELSTVVPRVGGQYAFFRESFHPLVAFLHGWSLLLIIQSGATAAVAVAFAQYLLRLLHLPPPLLGPLAVAVVLSLAAFHAIGVKPGAILLNLITIGKVLALGALAGGALLVGRGADGGAQPLVPPGVGGAGLLSLLLSALVPVMFAYGGWQNLSFVAEEVKDPLRNLPRAILIGVPAVLAVYLAANLAYLRVLGAQGLSQSRTPAAEVAARLLGEPGATAVSLLIVVSTFGYLNLALMTAPRVYYAMARDGLFFQAIARVSPRFRVPTTAILLQAGLAAALALSSAYERLLGYAVFADWIFTALCGVALIVLRRRRPAAPRPFPAPLYPVLPLLFTAAGAGIVLNGFVADPRNALLASAIMALGVPVYLGWRRRAVVAAAAATATATSSTQGGPGPAP